MRQGMLLLAALMCGSATAQVVNKCIGKGGAVHFYSGPCPAGYQHVKTWDAEPEPSPTNAELWRRYYERKQGEADSRYLSQLAGTSRGATGHRVRQDGAHNAAACDAAKASRESTLAAVGMRRNYELLQQLDNNVREACK